MGIEIDTKMTEHTIKEFWGGKKRGACLQITATKPLKVCKTVSDQIQEEGFIQLTTKEAVALCNDLKIFIK